jgi:hypothetical protein
MLKPKGFAYASPGDSTASPNDFDSLPIGLSYQCTLTSKSPTIRLTDSYDRVCCRRKQTIRKRKRRKLLVGAPMEGTESIRKRERVPRAAAYGDVWAASIGEPMLGAFGGRLAHEPSFQGSDPGTLQGSSAPCCRACRPGKIKQQDERAKK